MVKPAEIREVIEQGRFHTALMVYTAVAVPLTDFLTGVLSALVLYAVLRRFAEPRSVAPGRTPQEELYAQAR